MIWFLMYVEIGRNRMRRVFCVSSSFDRRGGIVWVVSSRGTEVQSITPQCVWQQRASRDCALGADEHGHHRSKRASSRRLIVTRCRFVSAKFQQRLAESMFSNVRYATYKNN